LWLPPKKYEPKAQAILQPPVMTLNEYTVSGLIDKHPMPYVFALQSKTSIEAVMLFGLEHTCDPTNKQLMAMKEH